MVAKPLCPLYKNIIKPLDRARYPELRSRYETLPVNENDVLTIGKHYQFLIKIFDVEKARLTEDMGFEELTDNSMVTGYPYEEATNQNVSNDFYTPTQNKDNSSRTVLY